LPVGVPVPWPSATPPTGWLKCNGAAFSAEEHPELAKVYPTNELPDLRGEFIRGWDDGRGVDSGRNLVTAQGDAIRNIAGEIYATTAGNSQAIFSGASGAFTQSGFAKIPNISANSGTGDQRSSAVGFSASLQVPTALENRPRNVAFNYIVRAA
ncbi:TPA: tail fiber protein, partial [Escherichia coli]|nr:tail fiber protein [Escherichia coli]